MSRYAWLTPDDPPGDPVCFRVSVPGGDAYEAALRGALALLVDEQNWELTGSQTPEAVAQAFLDNLFITYQWRRCVHVGTVFFYAGPNIPSDCLFCDGAEVSRTTYAALFAAIGVTFGSGESGGFNLPDLRGMVPLGTGEGNFGGDYALADQGGEMEHDLSTSEIPSHHHGIHAHGPVPGLFVSPGEVPASIPWLFGGDTDDTGGGNAHNNMPPFLALQPLIQAF